MALFTGFDPAHATGIAIAGLLGLAAAVLHMRRPGAAITTLTLAACILRVVSATLDPFLNDWDEAFHAVVAKNLMSAPLTPMLFREAALPITTGWGEQHIWLHKPPFFLWQIALSLKVFGLHPWAVRIPSVFWTTLLVPVIWRIGTLLRSERTGFIAALLATFSFMLQELTVGMINTDHNDTVFIALIACSWWAWLEHMRKAVMHWAIAAGAFSAGAVLTKWHVGAIVFGPWCLWAMHERFRPAVLKGLLSGAFTFVLPVSAWLFHIFSWFPAEARFEWYFKSHHFTLAMDGHTGTGLFHFDAIGTLLPPFTWWIILPSCGYLIRRLQHPAHRLLVAFSLLAVHLFFAFAATKMVCYTMVLLPIYLVAVGCVLDDALERIRNVRAQKLGLVFVCAVLGWYGFDLPRIQATHTLEETRLVDRRWRIQKLDSTNELRDLYRVASGYERPVIFNVPRNAHLRFMFTHGIEAWDKLPEPEDVSRLRAKGYTVLILQDGKDPAGFPLNTVLIPDSLVHISDIVRI